jgi:hypothetical protein
LSQATAGCAAVEDDAELVHSEEHGADDQRDREGPLEVLRGEDELDHLSGRRPG